MNILEDYRKIQKTLFEALPSELLDLRYSGYAFGSGMVAFRVKGINFQIVYDGRDNQVEIGITKAHTRYPANEWKIIWKGNPTDLENSTKIVREYLA